MVLHTFSRLVSGEAGTVENYCDVSHFIGDYCYRQYANKPHLCKWCNELLRQSEI